MLSKMPQQWQNKRLILSTATSTVDTVCQTLCNMVSVGVHNVVSLRANF